MKLYFDLLDLKKKYKSKRSASPNLSIFAFANLPKFSKKCLLFVVFVLGYTHANAQLGVERGDNILNIGVGPVQSYYSGLGFSDVIPPISVSYERILNTGSKDMNGMWGVGLYVGFASNKFEYLYSSLPTHIYKYNHIFVGPRGTFHYKFVNNLDTYGGLFLGYDIVSKTETGQKLLPTDDPKIFKSAPAWAMFVGGRYFFNHDFAAMLEIGFGVTFINAGIAVKFRT